MQPFLFLVIAVFAALNLAAIRHKARHAISDVDAQKYSVFNTWSQGFLCGWIIAAAIYFFVP